MTRRCSFNIMLVCKSAYYLNAAALHSYRLVSHWLTGPRCYLLQRHLVSMTQEVPIQLCSPPAVNLTAAAAAAAAGRSSQLSRQLTSLKLPADTFLYDANINTMVSIHL